MPEDGTNLRKNLTDKLDNKSIKKNERCGDAPLYLSFSSGIIF